MGRDGRCRAWIGLLAALPLAVGGCAGTRAVEVHEDLDGVLWLLTAAEHWGLSRQVFRSARERLDEALVDPRWTAAVEQDGAADLPPAVIADVDETVLDNSPFEAEMLLAGGGFDGARWKEWVERAEAPALPGAVEFARYAAARGVRLFYVTNRDVSLEEGTTRNLRARGFPVAAGEDVVLTRGERGWGSDKGPRRRYVAQRYRILLLLGDDLNDFVSGVYPATPEARLAVAERYADYWGRRWLVLPNPIYGSWQHALLGARDSELTPRERLARRTRWLEGLGPSAESQ